MNVGEKLQAEIEIAGNPQPEVMWYKNQVKLNSGNQLKLLRHGNKYCLVISQAKVCPEN